MKEREGAGGTDPRRALRNHLARCGVCLTTDPAAMCDVGDVLLEAAAASIMQVDTLLSEETMGTQERMLRESLLDHALVCTHGCAIEGSRVVKVCPVGQAVEVKLSETAASCVREVSEDDIPF